jgi:DNA-binding transcriptional ArsR family regulator
MELAGPNLLEIGALQQAAEYLRALGHPVRLRMVEMLLGGQYTVGELAEACQIPSHAASEHLRLMQRCGFLACRRAGRRKYYQVADPCLRSLMDCVEHRFDRPAGPRPGRGIDRELASRLETQTKEIE